MVEFMSNERNNVAENEGNKKIADAWSLQWFDGQPSSPQEWDAAVRNSADTFLYHLSDMAPLFVPPECSDPLRFIECRLNGALVGGAVLTLNRRSWHHVAERRACRSFIGPLSVSPFLVDGIGKKNIEEAWDRLLEGCAGAARDLGCEKITLLDTIQSRRCMDERPVMNRYLVSTAWTGWMMWNYILDLRQDTESLWKNLETRCRTSIRRGRECVKAVLGNELEGGDEAYVVLMNAVSAREGVVLIGDDNLRAIWKNVYDGDHGLAVLCLDKTTPCTFTGVTRFGNVASYHHAGRRDDAPNGAAALGLWTAIEWAKSVGCSWFDLNGVIPEKVGRERMRVLSMFKRGFGGDVVPVYGATRKFHPLVGVTYDFIDAWGVEAKKHIRNICGKGKRKSET
jgi:hypothetical protein